MHNDMSTETKEQILIRLRRRYATAGMEHKSKLLDQAVELLGYHRKAAIRALTATAFERFPTLHFEIDTVLEHRDRILILYRKLNVFSTEPGLTIEIFDLAGDQICRSTVYWGVEEVAARF